MSKPIALKRGDRVICTHYRRKKDRGPFTVANVHNREIWLVDGWWGPRKWFRKIPGIH